MPSLLIAALAFAADAPPPPAVAAPARLTPVHAPLVPQQVSIDFDGDGRMDRVVVERRGEGAELVAYRAGDPAKGVRVALIGDPHNFYVQHLEPGNYPAGRSELAVDRPTLAYGMAGEALVAAEWTGKGFRETVLSF